MILNSLVILLMAVTLYKVKITKMGNVYSYTYMGDECK